MKVKISEVSESTVWNSKRNVCLLYEDEERSLAAIYYISVLIYKLLCLLTMPPCTTSILIFQLGAIMSAEIDLWILCLACWRTMYTQGLCLSNPSLAFFLPLKSWNSSWGGDFTCAAITMSQPLRWIRARLLFWHSSHEMQLKICIYPAPLHYLNYPQRSPLNNSSRKGSDCFINNNRKKPLELTGKIRIMLHLQVTHSTSLTPTTLKPS